MGSVVERGADGLGVRGRRWVVLMNEAPLYVCCSRVSLRARARIARDSEARPRGCPSGKGHTRGVEVQKNSKYFPRASIPRGEATILAILQR